MARYLITGIAGFIGSNIAEYLINAGEKVTGLDNFSTGKKETVTYLNNLPNHHNLDIIEGDIRDADICKTACSKADFVLHQAALGSVPRSMKYPLLYNDVNITGTLNMLNAAKENDIKRFVFASSSSVYGDTPVLPKVETMPTNPKSPYALSKLTGEHYCKLFNDVYNLNTIALRYFNVFGPRQDPESQYAAVIPKFITALLKNESPTIYGDGSQTRDFTFISNVIQANLASCNASPEAFGNAFNIGCGGNTSINHLAQIIKKETHSTSDINYVDARDGDVKDSQADTEKSQRLLNLPPFESLESGLKKTTNWYKNTVSTFKN